MSEEIDLKTQKPTCGSGEYGIPDDQILDSHAYTLRNQKEPMKWFHTTPFILVLLFGGIAAWAGLSISPKSSFFKTDIQDFTWSNNTAPQAGQQTAGDGDAEGPSSVIAKGKTLYNTPGSCVTCHMANGQGNLVAKFPPLANSEWVTGSEEVVTRIVLHGIQGPLKVGGQEYGLVPMVPTIWTAWPDEDIAAVITYIRSDWGNEAPAVSAETVKRIRDEVGARGPWTAEELEALK